MYTIAFGFMFQELGVALFFASIIHVVQLCTSVGHILIIANRIDSNQYPKEKSPKNLRKHHLIFIQMYQIKLKSALP